MMTAVATKLLSLLIVLSSAAVRVQTNSTDCSSSQWSYDEFLEKLKISDECVKALTAQWTENQTAAILSNMNRLVDVLKKNEKSGCKDATPKECPVPAVQSKGGILCVSAKGKRYCKPMCNEGYDFGFLRTSRLYEECSNATRHTWTTQYVGGKKLAVCNKSNIQIAGVPSAYFPENQDCWVTKSNSRLEEEIIHTFENELSKKDIKGPYTHTCLLCG
ncbi:uncharacterized protein si:ch1073-126c3.2 [Neoarius graeffei]|uniref:uncharacterized protein si:ch1073-126c3.2 n=1 Tax=Neoarius graeffei TaxID=443677 RepID=UPI00298BED4D|nr:uncharacterized protein si:ch1073-126c3.2 [Neoarius graeffei]